MNRRDALKRGGLAIGGTIALAGCTEEALVDAESEPPFVEELPIESSELDLPIERVHDVLEAGIETAEDADIGDVEALETFLEDHGLSVEEATEEEGIVELPREEIDEEEAEEEVVDEGDVENRLIEATIVVLEYALEERAERGAVRSIGIVAGGYAALVESDHDSALLEAEVLDSTDVAFGSYEVESRRAEEYNADEIGAATYGDTVLTTVESK